MKSTPARCQCDPGGAAALFVNMRIGRPLRQYFRAKSGSHCLSHGMASSNVEHYGCRRQDGAVLDRSCAQLGTLNARQQVGARPRRLDMTAGARHVRLQGGHETGMQSRQLRFGPMYVHLRTAVSHSQGPPFSAKESHHCSAKCKRGSDRNVHRLNVYEQFPGLRLVQNWK